MQAVTTPPVFSSRWRHLALTYSQPYVMMCKGAGFEVKDGSNYDFNRNFSIAMTFSASDVNTEQGLLYKGTASPITSPQLSHVLQGHDIRRERDLRHHRRDEDRRPVHGTVHPDGQPSTR